jgi:hypothetical protein
MRFSGRRVAELPDGRPLRFHLSDDAGLPPDGAWDRACDIFEDTDLVRREMQFIAHL